LFRGPAAWGEAMVWATKQVGPDQKNIALLKLPTTRTISIITLYSVAVLQSSLSDRPRPSQRNATTNNPNAISFLVNSFFSYSRIQSKYDLYIGRREQPVVDMTSIPSSRTARTASGRYNLDSSSYSVMHPVPAPFIPRLLHRGFATAP